MEKDQGETRRRRQTKLLTYSGPGEQGEINYPAPRWKNPAPSGAGSKKSASPSVMSIQGRMKTIQLDSQTELTKLTLKHQLNTKKLEFKVKEKQRNLEELEEVRKNLELIPADHRDEGFNPEHKDVISRIRAVERELMGLQDQIQNDQDVFEIQRNSLKDTLEQDKQRLQIEADEANDQRFDSDEEDLIRKFDQANALPPVQNQDDHHVNPQRNIINHSVERVNRPPAAVVNYGHHINPPPSDHGDNDDHCSAYFSTHDGPPPRKSTSSDLSSQVLQVLNAQLQVLERNPSSKDRDLPTFTGKAEEWPIFLSEYTRTTSLSPNQAEKSRIIIRLRKALKGAAKDAVVGLLDDPDSLPTIITKLKSRFGRPEYIIKSLISKVREAKPPKVDNPASIIQFGTEVQNLVVRVKILKEPRYLYDISLLDELVSKLPHSYAEQWVMWLLEEPSRDKSLQTFSDWLELKVAVAEQLYHPVIQEETKHEDKGRRHRPAVHAAGGEEIQPPSFEKVPSLKELPLEERLRIVREMRLCFLCLRQGHSSLKCKSEKTCHVDNCGRRHHHLLHKAVSNRPSAPRGVSNGNRDDPTIPSAPPASPPSSENSGNMSTAQCGGSLPIIPVWIFGPKGKKKVYALLDTGSSFTMMEKSVADEIGLEGPTNDLNFTVFGDKRSEKSNTVQFSVSGTFRNAPKYAVCEGHTCSKLGLPGTTVNAEELKTKYPHLRRMRTKSTQNAVPQMLLGYDCYGLFYSKWTLEPENPDDPYAFKSKLGWYVLLKGNSKVLSFANQIDADEELHATVKHFFSSESFGTKPVLNSERSKDDKRALELLEKLTVKKKERWETGLLWKNDHVELPDSKPMAVKRLRGMEKKMDSNAEFAELVQSKFDDYIQKGYLIPRKNKDVENEIVSKRKWFLPWFFSYHPTKKPRLVFDAAAKANGTSLNDYLMKGPDLLNPLQSVLVRFRRHHVAITADIKEMFHQILLREEDWPSQTILYRGMDRSTEPQEYYMSVLFFGAASSPCSAIYAKNLNAEQFRNAYPVAVDAILDDFYMDDYLGGAETEEEAIQLRSQITEIHQAGGFQIVKWSSSSETVWKSIPEDIRAEGDLSFASKDDVHVEKTLGLYWSPSKDEFCFKLNFHRVRASISAGECIPTKREMTSVVMALFDPVGYLSPLKVKALILIQDVWRSGIGWDDQIPVNIFTKWKEWLMLLQQVERIKIDRKMTSIPDPENVEMHVFSDASEEAFASSIYLTFETGGRKEVAIIMGKSRVAPLRGLTIPKMELQAALLGSRLASNIKKMLGESIKITRTHFWSDSKSVLCQVRSSTLRYKVFEANRIGEILELTDVQQWKWIPTQSNVADDATRSSSICEMNSNCRWLKGSEFLYKPQEEWPQETVNVSTNVPLADMGVKVVSAAALSDVVHSPCPDLSRFSSYYRLLRCTAYLYVYQRLIRKKGPAVITIEDIRKAKSLLIRHSQMESFPEEYSALAKGEPVKKTSRLYQLSPQINEDGVIGLGGRINNAPKATPSLKNPPILSPKHRLAQLLIVHHHEFNGHHGQEKLVNDLRQEAWILDCRAAVRSCWAKCMTCKLRSCTPKQPEMGQIPAARLGESHRPFHHTGIDYFGPFTVTIGRKLFKRWGALFTCLSSRAVHLELVDSLDSSDMVNALVRFICIRGRPAHIWTDNGTNFIGASREIREALLKNRDALREGMLIRQIEWHNIPPSSPFMGGAWESLIGIVKRILKTMLREQHPKETTLRTLFTEIGEIMNNRPLTYVSSNPEDPDCITPNSLMRLENVSAQTIRGGYQEGDRFRKSWRHGQYLADNFWRRWIREYLPKLAKREKWHQKTEPLQVGDLVLVVDDQCPRSGWKKGIITAVYPGKDRQVRVVDVKVAHVKSDDPKKKVAISIYRRPAAKICPLGINVASSRWEGEMAVADIE